MKKNQNIFMRSKAIKLYSFLLLAIISLLLINLNLVLAADSTSFGGGVPTSFSGGNYRVYGASVNPQFNQPSFYGGFETDVRSYWGNFNKEDCKERQDVILMIPPGGCSPAVVRSDLLEEQDVPVFCKVSSIQVNPLIDITKIRSIHFKGEYPKGVAGLSYFPARLAVRADSKLIGSPIVDNVGYLVIKLRKTPNEKDMPEWLGGNVTAVVDYDSEGVFGVGEHDFYLTETDEEEWQNQYKSYGFWKGKGFIRAEAVDEDSARISIYKDATEREASVDLKEGETSRDIYLGGYYCAAGMNIKVEDVGYPVDTALLRVDDEDLWLGKGSQFLDGKCRVTNLEVYDVGGGKASFSCTGAGRFDLMLKDAGISLNVASPLAGKNPEDNYVIGEKITSKDGKDVYLAYTGKYPGSKNTYNVLVAIPQGTNEFSGLGSFIHNKEIDYPRWKRMIEIKQTAKSSWQLLIPGWNLFFIGKEVYDALSPEEQNFYKYLLENINDNPKYPLKEGDLKILITPGSTWEQYGITLNELKSGETLLQENPLLKEYYDNAVLNYEEVFNLYPNEKERPDDDNLDPYAVTALYNSATLSGLLGLQGEQIKSLEKLIENYPDSKLAKTAETELETVYKRRFSIDSQAIVYVNNEPHFISLIDIKKPSYDKLGAKLEVTDKGKWETFEATKDETKTTIESKFPFKIKDIKETSVEIEYYEGLSWVSDVVNYVRSDTIGKKKTIEVGQTEQITKDVSIRLVKTNLEKTAKVKIIPKDFGMRTESDFNFKIGIEKRGIKLSPQKTQEMIDNLAKTIKQWEDINNRLGRVVSGLKAACFATSAVITVKNFFSGLSGESMARNEVMTMEGGWNDKCKQWSGKTGEQSPYTSKSYSSVQTCLLDHNAQINAAVSQYSAIIKQENEFMKKLGGENKIAGGDILDWQGQVDQEGLKQAYCEQSGFRSWYTQNQNTEIEIKGEGKQKLGDIIDPSKVINTADGKCAVDLEDMKMLMLKKKISEGSYDSTLEEVIDNKLKTGLKNTYDINQLTKKDSILDKSLPEIPSHIEDTEAKYQTMADVSKVPNSLKEKFNPQVTKVFRDYVNVGGEMKEVVVGLAKTSGDKYQIVEARNLSGDAIQIRIPNPSIPAGYTDYPALNYYKNKEFTLANSALYNHQFKEAPKVTYYERAPYKGLPAQVPIGKVGQTNGWYVTTDYILSGYGRPYEESGRAVNFWVCNVGENGIIDGKNRDDCRYYNLGSDADLKFPGLSATESAVLVDKAEKAIRDASSQYGKKRVTINGQVYETSIAENGESGNCADFMSPSDCNLLFNVCDPVMCPESRCDFGGKYRVANVVQSGIIGSLLLCLPNAKEGIAVPICISGVHAGIEGYLSILKSARDCLNESLATGRNIGICDEIKSIYMCEFFWRQAAPLIDVLIPNLFELALGQGTRGGGEYLTVDYAWNNVQNSIDWFKNDYAVNAMKSFTDRSTAGVGEGVCKSFVSARYPNGDLIGNLLEPDSPVQYHAVFSEDILTEATIPPTSHYKVYYHIYAGKDIGAHYLVYLKSPPESNMVHTLEAYVVDRGYIERGKEVDITKDFTGIAGYKELCISINGQDECGFKQVSTSWAVDQLANQYAANQATDRVTSASECVAGEPSLYSLANPNLQAGVQETISPELYKRGVIRVCSSENPGKSVDSNTGKLDPTNSSFDRWMRVGYCDNQAVSCWLDTQSVENVLSEAPDLLNKTLSEVSLDYVDELQDLTPEQIQEAFAGAKTLLEQISRWETSSLNDKTVIDGNIGETINNLKEVAERGGAWNYQKALAYFRLGEIYEKITRKIYDEVVKAKEKPAETPAEVVPTETIICDEEEVTQEPPATGTKIKDVAGMIWTKLSNGEWESAEATRPWSQIQGPIKLCEVVTQEEIIIETVDDEFQIEKNGREYYLKFRISEVDKEWKWMFTTDSPEMEERRWILPEINEELSFLHDISDFDKGVGAIKSEAEKGNLEFKIVGNEISISAEETTAGRILKYKEIRGDDNRWDVSEASNYIDYNIQQGLWTDETLIYIRDTFRLNMPTETDFKNMNVVDPVKYTYIFTEDLLRCNVITKEDKNNADGLVYFTTGVENIKWLKELLEDKKLIEENEYVIIDEYILFQGKETGIYIDGNKIKFMTSGILGPLNRPVIGEIRSNRLYFLNTEFVKTNTNVLAHSNKLEGAEISGKIILLKIKKWVNAEETIEKDTKTQIEQKVGEVPDISLEDWETISGDERVWRKTACFYQYKDSNWRYYRNSQWYNYSYSRCSNLSDKDYFEGIIKISEKHEKIEVDSNKIENSSSVERAIEIIKILTVLKNEDLREGIHIIIRNNSILGNGEVCTYEYSSGKWDVVGTSSATAREGCENITEGYTYIPGIKEIISKYGALYINSIKYTDVSSVIDYLDGA